MYQNEGIRIIKLLRKRDTIERLYKSGEVGNCPLYNAVHSETGNCCCSSDLASSTPLNCDLGHSLALIIFYYLTYDLLCFYLYRMPVLLFVSCLFDY